MKHFYYTRIDFSDLHDIDIVKDENGHIKVIENPYEFANKVHWYKNKHEDIVDTMHDYLLLYEKYPEWFTSDEINHLRKSGFDLNLDNWAEIIVPYLPFYYYLYLPENWVI